MWRKLFQPEFLFTLAAIQAISPYILWQLGIYSSETPTQHPGYLPLALWAMGCLSFCFGCSLVKGQRVRPTNLPFKLMFERSRMLAILCSALLAAQIFWAARVYGTLPIISYLRQDRVMTVGRALELQDNSFVGQFAMLRLTMYLLCAVVSILLLTGPKLHRKIGLPTSISLISMLVAATMNGKRGDLLRMGVTIFATISIATNNPFQSIGDALSRKFKGGAKITAYALAIVAVAGFFIIFGFFGTIRNQSTSRQSSLDEILKYQEYPLLNLENQCAIAGFGPYRLNFWFPFLRLFPYKIAILEDPTSIQPPRVIESSPASLFENFQWTLGPVGVIGYTMLLGVICRALYDRARGDVFSLLAYGQCISSIIFIPTVDEFTILLYVPAPLFLLFLLSRFLLSERLLPRRHSRNSLSTAARGAQAPA